MNNTKNTINLFNKFALTYQEKYMNVDAYAGLLKLFCDSILIENAAILELACGPGNITKYLLNLRPDFKLLGTDLAQNMLDLAKINNPTANFKLLDCREIHKVNQKYDGIVCGFCLPYLSKEAAIKLIDDGSNLLNKNGVFYVSTMEDSYAKSQFKGPSSGGDDKLFTNYHEADYLLEALEKSGLQILKLDRTSYPETDGTITTDLQILAKKI